MWRELWLKNKEQLHSKLKIANLDISLPGQFLTNLSLQFSAKSCHCWAYDCCQLESRYIHELVYPQSKLHCCVRNGDFRNISELFSGFHFGTLYWLPQGVKVEALGRQNERNSSYFRLSHTSIFGLGFMPVCLTKSNCYPLIYSSLTLALM